MAMETPFCTISNFIKNQTYPMFFKLILLIVFSFTLHQGYAQVIPGHAHNDYAVNQPLTEALQQGFMSIEADVHLIQGELYVAHDHPDTAQVGTLRELYLDPLASLVSRNNGKVYPDYAGSFFLMIDFKTPGPATWQVLQQQLASYQHMLSTAAHPGPVTVVISGNRPIEQILNDPKALATLDGRPADLAKGVPSSVMPVVSENLAKVAPWDGKTAIKKKDKEAIEKLARQAHAEGKLLRLWATPDFPEAWHTLLQAGVDLINTDRIAAFRQYYTQREEASKK